MNLEIKNLYFAYGPNEVVKNVSFRAEPGECIAILGINGVGKSTMLKCINKINRPKAGRILVDGKDISGMDDAMLAKHIGYVSQSCEFSDSTVFDAILLGRKPYIKWDVTSQDLQIVQYVLHLLSLETFSTKNVNELSGGERQKVSIARVLAQQTPILLFDEPTSNLDIKNQLEVLDIIKKIVQEHNLSAVVTIHDLNLALRFADKFLIMKDGMVYAFGDRSVVTAESICEVYGLHASVIDFAQRKVVIPE